MTDMVLQRNVGELITVRNGSTSNSLTAGGAGNNTTKTGIVIDRMALTSPDPLSMVASVLFDATLASGSTLAVQVVVNDSADNSTFAAYASNSSGGIVVATGPSGGGAVSGQVNLNVNLSSARRYIRIDHVPNLSRGGTDTALSRAVGVLAGFDRLQSPT